MDVFVKHIKRTDMKRNNVGDVLMAKQIAEDETKHLLDAIVESGNTFQCEQLLSVLAKSKFSNIYIQLDLSTSYKNTSFLEVVYHPYQK